MYTIVLMILMTVAQTSSPAGNAANGRAVFMKARCDSCHGTMGQGGPGGKLAPNPIPLALFTNYVRNGRVNNPAANRNWSGMPPFSTKFISDSELTDIYAYLVSIPAAMLPASNPLLKQE